jgi:DNA polymerase III delta prime subunit
MESKKFIDYNPQILEEIVGNDIQKKRIIDWLNNFDNIKHKCLLLSGNHGIGKSILVKLILKKLKISYRIISADEIKEFRVNDTFDSYFNNKKLKDIKFAFIFDEVEMITLASERKFILNLIKINTKNNLYPFIFISNNNHSKLVNDIKRSSIILNFASPTKNEIYLLIKKIAKINNIKIKNDCNLSEFINFSQFDIRRLILLLRDYSYNYKTLSNKNIKKFIENSVEKDIGVNLFDATNNIINDFSGFNKLYRLYETEKVLLPLMIHENYFKKILNDKKNFDFSIDKLINVSEALSIGDNIETSIYTDQNWYLQDIHCFFTCVLSSYLLNDNLSKKINNIAFSSDLNKTSLKNINKKNINNLSKLINTKSIEELLILCKMSNFCFKHDNEKLIIDILKKYNQNIDIKDIELCLKIDKCCDFIKLDNKKKKHINSLLNL